MEFAYDHVLIESSSPAEEIGVHTGAAACAENETRRYTYHNRLITFLYCVLVIGRDATILHDIESRAMTDNIIQ